jgi:hypothetical protein
MLLKVTDLGAQWDKEVDDPKRTMASKAFELVVNPPSGQQLRRSFRGAEVI